MSETNDPTYTITTETTDLRTSLAMNFYCEEMKSEVLEDLEQSKAELLAKKSIMAADAFLKALNEGPPDEKI